MEKFQVNVELALEAGGREWLWLQAIVHVMWTKAEVSADWNKAGIICTFSYTRKAVKQCAANMYYTER